MAHGIHGSAKVFRPVQPRESLFSSAYGLSAGKYLHSLGFLLFSRSLSGQSDQTEGCEPTSKLVQNLSTCRISAALDLSPMPTVLR